MTHITREVKEGDLLPRKRVIHTAGKLCFD